jgi:hypothetical protein
MVRRTTSALENHAMRVAYALIIILAACPNLRAQIFCRSYGVVGVDTCNGHLIADQVLSTTLARGAHVILHSTQMRRCEPCAHIGSLLLCTVDTVIGRRIILSHDLSGRSCSNDRLQLVIPVVDSQLSFHDTVRCLPWNGLHGGIVAIVGSTLDLANKTIDASKSGFRGGRQLFPRADTTTHQDTCNKLSSGEDLCALRSSTVIAVPRNGGGAGGCSEAYGGQGGQTSSAFLPVQDGARSVIAAAVSIPRLGQGGSAGHRNDLSSSDGGCGGGLIVIIADTIRSSNSTILSVAGGNGRTARADGAGGGGAGGCIVVQCASWSGECAIDLSGGDGGSVQCGSITSGPGGGGAGGQYMVGPVRVFAQSVNVKGGLAGNVLCESADRRRGAGDGLQGSISLRADLVQIPAKRTSLPVYIRADDTLVSYGASTILNVQAEGVVTWLRGRFTSVSQDGRRVQTEAITAPEWFVLEVDTPTGCNIRDSICVRPRIEANVLSIEADYIRATPGDTVDMFLRCTLTVPYTRTIQGVATLSTHAPIAFPVRNPNIVESRAVFRIPFTIASGTNSTFRREPLAIMLGDSLVSQISIDSISITGGALNIRRRHGRITLDSICVAGGRPRLFDPTASLLRVEGRTLHAEADELIISDLLGRRIPALTTAYASTMTAHVPDDVHGLVLITIMQNSRAYLRTLWFN